MIVLLALLAASAYAADFAYVQVKETQVRESASFMAKIVATIPYGTKVTVFKTAAAWKQVSLADGKTGWLSASALSTKALALKAGENRDTTASSQEVALAGKGFNAQVEAEYKAGNPALDFASIDRMESIKIAPGQMLEFLNTAGLKVEEGSL
ncbi:SH3 domain-containing protein [Treponema sp.]